MSGLHRLRVSELHPNLLCILCGGYYVDATTIIECLHSFCKTCIVRYLESSKFCPICDVQVHKTKPLLSIRPDKTLQDIVYKLVPGLYQNEMCKRREFYSSHPETSHASPEDGGVDLGRWYILPDDPVSLALHPTEASQYSSCNRHSLAITSQVSADKSEHHVRYLQCPAGVSVAQLIRLIRAKFGLGPSQPIALTTSSSESPLHDTLTLVDVAYITSWQRREPLQLFYQIYERASKKIKLDSDTFSCDSQNSSEDMPKLEPSVGEGAPNAMYDSSDSSSNMLDFRSAPLLQAVDSHISDASKRHTPTVMNTTVSGMTITDQLKEAQKSQMPESISDYGEKRSHTSVRNIDSLGKVEVLGKCDSETEPTQGIVGDSVYKVGPVGNSDNKVEPTVRGTPAVDNVLAYSRVFASPSNGVNLGVSYIPRDLSFINPTGVACAIIPSGGCIPVSGSCIPGTTTIPILCNTELQGNGEACIVNNWSSADHTKGSQLVSESAQVPSDVSAYVEKSGMEEEGKEVQLKISESGIMSVCGGDTTVEGVLNSLGSEACELLSKIESGSLGEDFPTDALDKASGKAVTETCGVKRTLTNDGQGEKSKSKGSSKGSKSIKSDNKSGKGKVQIKSNSAVATRVDSDKNIKEIKAKNNVVNHTNKDSNDTANLMDNSKSREGEDGVYKGQMNKQICDEGSNTNYWSSHIPASVTAASLANMNKPLLKAGTSKLPLTSEEKKDMKSNYNGMSVKTDAKLDLPVKPASSTGCRKSSQSYGYKTLKSPPKSWNPTISREQLALAAGKAASSKGSKDSPRTNKFFKARNAPKPLENPAGVKSDQSGVAEGSGKCSAMLKLNPKTLGTGAAPAKTEAATSSNNSLSSCSSTPSSIHSSSQKASPVLATKEFLPTRSDKQKTEQSVLPDSSEQTRSSGDHVSSVSGAGKEHNCTHVSLASSTPVPNEAKESTNTSSKLIKDITQKGNKTPISKLAKNDSNFNSSNKSLKSNSLVSPVAHSEKSVTKQAEVTKKSNTDTKISNGTVDATVNKVTCLGGVNTSMNQAKLGVQPPLTNTTSITPFRNEMISSVCAPGITLQPQQHLTICPTTVGVGILPSCGVSLAGAIGTLPLPYYTNPSLAYPTYPYMYQGADTISLIPPHHTSFIPTFPTCLPSRPPLSPRSIGGTKIIPDLSMQSSLLPMVPLVAQVPQALPSRPMTPPSPRAPLNHSPKPYPTLSPRQSVSRPLTPHSPHQLPSGLTTKTPSSSLLSLQPASSIPQAAVTHPPKITTSSSLVTSKQSSKPHAVPPHHMGPPLPFAANNSAYTQNYADQLNTFIHSPVSHSLVNTKSLSTSVGSAICKPSPTPCHISKSSSMQNSSEQFNTYIQCTGSPTSITTTKFPSNSSNSSKPYASPVSTSFSSCSGVGLSSMASPIFSVTSSCSSPSTPNAPQLPTPQHIVPQINYKNPSPVISASQGNLLLPADSRMIPANGKNKSSEGQEPLTKNIVTSSSVTAALGILLPSTASSVTPPISSNVSMNSAMTPHTSADNSLFNFPMTTSTTSYVDSLIFSMPFSAPGNNVSSALPARNTVSSVPSFGGSNSNVNTHMTSSSIASRHYYPPGMCPPGLSNSILPGSFSNTKSQQMAPSLIGAAGQTCKINPMSPTVNDYRGGGTVVSSVASYPPTSEVTSSSKETLTSNICTTLSTPVISSTATAAIGSNKLPANAPTALNPNTSQAVNPPVTGAVASLCSTVYSALPTVSSYSLSTPDSTIMHTVSSCSPVVSKLLKATSEGSVSHSSLTCAILPCSSYTGTVAVTKHSDSTPVSQEYTKHKCAPDKTENKVVNESCSAKVLPTKNSTLPESSVHEVYTTASLGSRSNFNTENTNLNNSVPMSRNCMLVNSVGSVGSIPPPVNTSATSVSLSSSSTDTTPQNTSGIFSSSNTVCGNSKLHVKERGGSVPHSSACTPVCDVKHVIDAKQLCAVASVSSSDGPRPCLKS